jgi:hypothetical protein
LPDTEKGAANPEPGYYGSPSRASTEFAEASIQVMVEEAGQVIARCLGGEDVTAETTSPLYRAILLRPGFNKYLVISIISVAFLIIVILFIYGAFLS